MKEETNTAFYRRLKIWHKSGATEKRYLDWAKVVRADWQRRVKYG